MRFLGIAVLLFTTGCAIFPPFKPQKGGGATVGPVTPEMAGNGLETPLASISQPENPNGVSKQDVGYRKTREITLPVATSEVREQPQADGTVLRVETFLPAGTAVKETIEHNVKQEIGGAWQDTAREVAAKLGSFKSVQWLGAAFMLLAAACLHPLVRATVGGGKQFPMACAGIGVLLIFGPSLVVGNEKVFIIGGIIAAVLVFLLVRLSHKEGKEDASKQNNG